MLGGKYVHIKGWSQWHLSTIQAAEKQKSKYDLLFSSFVTVKNPDLFATSSAPKMTSSEVEKVVRSMKRRKNAVLGQVHAEEVEAGDDHFVKASSGRDREQCWFQREETATSSATIDWYACYRICKDFYAISNRYCAWRKFREQAASRKRLSTVYHIFAVTQLTERYGEAVSTEFRYVCSPLISRKPSTP